MNMNLTEPQSQKTNSKVNSNLEVLDTEDETLDVLDVEENVNLEVLDEEETTNFELLDPDDAQDVALLLQQLEDPID